jgi:hypothetical protein
MYRAVRLSSRINSYISPHNIRYSCVSNIIPSKYKNDKISHTKKQVLGYISDLHLERNHKTQPYDIAPTSDYLMLGGDNGDPFKDHYRELLIYASMNFEKTVFIAGNHEYDRVSDPTIVIDRLHEISHDLSNVEFLNRTATDIAGYTVLGVTLWTPRDKSYSSYSSNNSHSNNSSNNSHSNNSNSNNSSNSSNSSNMINRSNRSNMINSMHYQDIDWLSHMLYTKKKKIVLTHHIPTFRLRSPFYKHFPNQCMFYNKLDHLLNGDDIYAWICGHSHCKYTKIINDTYCGINAYGVNRDVMPTLEHITL